MTPTLSLLLTALALAPLLALAAPTSNPAATSPLPGPDVSRIPPTRPPDKEILYKKIPQKEGGGDLKLFVYLPPDWKSSDQRPAIIFFFGGGWRIGNPAQFLSKAEYFASRGMVAISAEYRISSLHQTTLKQAVEDARSAMRYLRKNAPDLGIDPDKIIASGGSAGGHLAAALCFDASDDPADNLSISCKPNALVLFNPVLDLLAPLNAPQFRNIIWDRAPGNTDDEKKKSLAQFSPIEHLKKDEPPTLLFYGQQDYFLLDAKSFAQKSSLLGNKIEILTAPNVGHGFFNAQPWHTATLIQADQFLSALGYLKGPPTLKPTEPTAVLLPDK